MKTDIVKARVSSELKNEAEMILSQLGMGISDAIRILLHQIVLRREFPLDLKLPSQPHNQSAAENYTADRHAKSGNMNLINDEKYQVYALTSDILKTVFLSNHISFEGKSVAFHREDLKTYNRGTTLQAKLNKLSDAEDLYIGLDYQVSNGDEYQEVIKMYKKNGYTVLGRPKLVKSNKEL